MAVGKAQNSSQGAAVLEGMSTAVRKQENEDGMTVGKAQGFRQQPWKRDYA